LLSVLHSFCSSNISNSGSVYFLFPPPQTFLCILQVLTQISVAQSDFPSALPNIDLSILPPSAFSFWFFHTNHNDPRSMTLSSILPAGSPAPSIYLAYKSCSLKGGNWSQTPSLFQEAKRSP
jgi:hypothetical protein